MITLRRLYHHRKISIIPRKLTRLDDDAPHRSAVTTNKFRCRLYDDICTKFDWLTKIWGCERVIDHQRNSCVMGNLCHSLNIQNIYLRVSHCLRINRFGFFCYCFTKVIWISRIYKNRVNPKLTKCDIKLRICSTIQSARRHQVISIPQKREQCTHLRSLS